VLPDAEKERLARKLRKLLPLPQPQIPDPPPGTDKLREKFGVPAGEELDRQMVQLSLVALVELMEEIQRSATATWVGLEPRVQGRMETLTKPALSQFLGAYLSLKWKENLQKLLKDLKGNAARAKGLTIGFEQIVNKMTEVLEAESPEPAALVELLRGLVELRIPNPSMIIAVLAGGMLGGPGEFGRDFVFLFDCKRIEREVQRTKPGADGRDFWSLYSKKVDGINSAYLADTMRQKLLSGATNHPLFPDYPKP